MTVFNIYIYFDTICPWCFTGDKSLSKTLSLYRKTYPGGSSDTFNLTWLPHYLYPDGPSPEIPIQQRMEQKMGADRVTGVQARLKRVGQANGVNFSFAGKTGNTRTSHGLVQLGRTKGGEMQARLVEEICIMHFENGGDITSKEDLVTAGVAAGLDECEVKKWLESEQGGEEVDKAA